MGGVVWEDGGDDGGDVNGDDDGDDERDDGDDGDDGRDVESQGVLKSQTESSYIHLYTYT